MKRRYFTWRHKRLYATVEDLADLRVVLSDGAFVVTAGVHYSVRLMTNFAYIGRLGSFVLHTLNDAGDLRLDHVEGNRTFFVYNPPDANKE